MQKGIWIWENAEPRYDEYADFRQEFTLSEPGRPVSIRLSSDSNHAVYVNGELAAFGQYADLPHCKVADTHDLTAFCRPGVNTLLITVWYHGAPSSIYRTGQAGLFFELTVDGELAAVSGTHTPCRKNPCYVPYRKKYITKELGFSCFYRASGAELPWHPAVATGYEPELHPRPILPLTLEPLRPGAVIGGNGKTSFLLDLGREEAGFFEFSLESDTEQTIVIAWSELLVDGKVRRFVGVRDFSLEYGTRIGENHHLNPFRRLGCRYLSVEAEHPIRLRYAGVRPTMYPVTELPFDAGSLRRQQIYETAKRTLRLCMHEHYEDCPWREQALYAMDSRNQMLCGYYAFGETRYARANLWLLGQDRREDGMLSDCVPSGIGMVIPSFCLHWYQEVAEYTRFSGDLTLAREIWDKLCDLLNTFLRWFDREQGLLACPPSEEYWNFYEWSGRFLMGNGRHSDAPNLLLNCLFLRALDHMTELSALTGLPFGMTDMAEPLRRRIRETFRRPDGLYQTDLEGTHICELGNALAVLTGVADEADARVICGVLSGRQTVLPVERIPIDPAVLTRVDDRTTPDADIIRIVPVSLSMSAFVYDALLATDREAYADFVLADIDSRFGMMLDAGADTFWETMGGWRTFAEAGSLCHGWSAIAIYYYHQLL